MTYTQMKWPIQAAATTMRLMMKWKLARDVVVMEQKQVMVLARLERTLIIGEDSLINLIPYTTETKSTSLWTNS